MDNNKSNVQEETKEMTVASSDKEASTQAENVVSAEEKQEVKNVENKPVDNADSDSKSDEDLTLEELKQRYKQVTGKMSALEKEKNNLAKFNQVLIQWSARDPERYKDLLVSVGGLTQEQAEAKLAEMRKKYPQLWNKPTQTQKQEVVSGAQPQQVQPGTGQVQEQEDVGMQEPQTVVSSAELKAATDFLVEKYPMLKQPENMTVARYNKLQSSLEVLHYAAERLATTEGISYVDAVKRLSDSLMEDVVKTNSSETSVEDKVSSQAQANAVNAGVSNTTVAGVQKNKVELTQTEIEYAKRAGLTPEEYARLKRDI